MPDPDWGYEFKMVQGLLERDARNCELHISRLSRAFWKFAPKRVPSGLSVSLDTDYPFLICVS